MTMELKEYVSLEKVVEAVDRKIAHAKARTMKELLRLDKLRRLVHRSRNVNEAIIRLAGKGFTKSGERMDEITIGNLTVVLDADRLHELAMMEEVVRSYQEKLLILQKTRESLKWFDQMSDIEEFKFLVLEQDGVPERIMPRMIREL